MFLASGPSPASALLGWELVAEDARAGTIEVAFRPDERMLNPHGTVQGGFIAAMLDDTMEPAFANTTGGKTVPSSVDMTVSFLRPVQPGRVIKAGRSIVFLEGKLFDEAGRLLARATSSAIPMAIDR